MSRVRGVLDRPHTALFNERPTEAEHSGNAMTILEKLFKSRRDTPIIPPVELTMGGPAIDTPEELIPEESRSADAIADIAGLSFVINYENSTGETSLRAVTCHAIEPGPPEVLRAHCHLRDAERRFNIDQIHQIVELDTGEVLEDSDLRDFLATYTHGFGPGDPADIQRHFQHLAGPAVQVLVFLAASDGYVHPTEQNVILEFAASESERLMPGQPFDREATARWIRNLKPPQAVAREAISRLAEDEERVEAFSEVMIRLVRADGVIDEDEAKATREIVEAIRAAREN